MSSVEHSSPDLGEKPRDILVWADIPVLDLQRAMLFYSRLFDAPLEEVKHDGLHFVLLPHYQNNVSACLACSHERKPSLNGPLIYLNTPQRIDEILSQVVAWGGKIIAGKETIGEYGDRAVIEDCEGNGIAIYSK